MLFPWHIYRYLFVYKCHCVNTGGSENKREESTHNEYCFKLRAICDGQGIEGAKPTIKHRERYEVCRTMAVA